MNLNCLTLLSITSQWSSSCFICTLTISQVLQGVRVRRCPQHTSTSYRTDSEQMLNCRRLLRAILWLVAALSCGANGGGMQDMVSAALQYLSSSDPSSPAPPPAPAEALNTLRSAPRAPMPVPAVRNISGTSSFAQAQAQPEWTKGTRLSPCGNFSQMQQLTGVFLTRTFSRHVMQAQLRSWGLSWIQ